jgi:5-methylcytosine-specific restriction enzyme subunit McrC
VKAERRSWPAHGDPDHVMFLPALNADVVVRGYGVQVVIECKVAPIFIQHQTKTMVKPSYVRQLVSYATVFYGEYAGETREVLRGALVEGSKGRDLAFSIDGIPHLISNPIGAKAGAAVPRLIFPGASF